jgi:hypothetical protein
VLPEAQKTWNAARDHFQTFLANNGDEVLTTGSTGFTANHVEVPLTQMLTQTSDIITDINAQMANLGECNVTQATSNTGLTCEVTATAATTATTTAMIEATAETDDHHASQTVTVSRTARAIIPVRHATINARAIRTQQATLENKMGGSLANT